MPKLLVVDDEGDIREFAQRFFIKRGIEVLTASNGEEALRLIAEQRPDLVLLDVLMEGMTGIDVLKELRANKNDIKAIIITGTVIGDEKVMNEASNLGVCGFIHKPLMLGELEKIVLEQIQK